MDSVASFCDFFFYLFKKKNYLFIFFLGKVELHGKRIEVEHSVPKKQRYLVLL